jgi:hypothetical protein
MNKIEVLVFVVFSLLFTGNAYCQSTLVHINGVEGVIVTPRDSITEGFRRFIPTMEEVCTFEDAFAKNKKAEPFKNYKRQYIGYYGKKSGVKKLSVMLISPNCAKEHPEWMNDGFYIMDDDRIAIVNFDLTTKTFGEISVGRYL